MEYYKKDNNDCVVVDDGRSVPNSIKITKDEYDLYNKSRPIGEAINDIVEYEDVETGKILKLRKVK